MNQQTLEYDLYLDESGDFMETSTDPRERARSTSKKEKFPSQLAGLLVPRGDIDKTAKSIVNTGKSIARLPLGDPIHASRMPYGLQYLTMAKAIISEVAKQRQWQAVRLVNLEKVSYGERVSIYTNLVAELALRIFQEKSKTKPEEKIHVRLFPASVMLRIPGDPVDHPLRKQEYKKRIDEYLGFAAVRHGHAREQRNWVVDDFQIMSAKETAAIQVCDVLSNASHKNFTRLKTQAGLAQALKRLFGEYDFTLAIRELFERVDELTREYSFGMSLMILAEALVHVPHSTEPDQEFAEKLRGRLAHIIERLGRMDFRGRDPQLALLIGWLDQLVGQQRLLDKGYEIAHWLLENVEAPLRNELSLRQDGATLDWFAYSLRRWAMTACNHKGVLLQAQAEVEAMKALQPSVAKQWERIPLVMDGLIAQAVHYADCFEFDEASRLMHFVSESLKTQSNRFHELMPNDFPEKLRFDLRARALGTLVQSEIFAGTTDVNRLQNAREASDEAIAEFTSFSDRSRQYQYRCHLETVARDFPTARRYLVKSLERTDGEPPHNSHNRIAELIRDFSVDPEWKAEFTLLHWLRIGAYASLEAREGNGDRSDVERDVIESERDQFLAALDGSEQLNSDACQGRLLDYPGHSILRFVAVINAARGNWDESLRALQHLQALDPIGKAQFVLAMILLAAQTEVAALMWRGDETRARTLLSEENSDLKSLTQLVQQIDEGVENRVTALSASSQSWRVGIENLTAGSPLSTKEPTALLKLARANAY